MKRQSGFSIMKRLLVELKPLAPVMMITITLGVLGFLTAITLTTLGAVAIGTLLGDVTAISFKGALYLMALCAVLRGFLRYGEQLSGHYIAFKILESWLYVILSAIIFVPCCGKVNTGRPVATISPVSSSNVTLSESIITSFCT